jgi:hypothetical protein
MIYEYSKLGLGTTLDTVGEVAMDVNIIVERTGGKFEFQPLENGGIAAGITWHF